jgi:hypothetical protein
MGRWRFIIAGVTAVAAAACGSPTAPDSRSGVIFLAVACTGDGTTPLECTARTACTGYCTGEQNAGLQDMTASAAWAVDGAAVRHVGRGRFEAVATGDVRISASLPGTFLSVDGPPAAVFPGRQPVPTYALSGTVGVGIYEPSPFGPRPVFSSYLNGASVEILNGLVAGRREVTGRPPLLLPGFFPGIPPFGDGSFRFLGVPSGSYELEILPPGRPPTRVTVSVGFSGFVNVVLP